MTQSLKQYAATAAGLLVVDIIFFATSDPQAIPAYMLMAACLLVTITLWMIVSLLVRLAQQQGLITHAHKRLRVALTATAGGLLALQSVNQLSSRDILVATPLVILGYAYLAYGKPLINTVNNS